MSDGLSGFQRAWADAIDAARRRADENDQRMLDALQGKPFWRRGPAVEVTGLAEFIPSPDPHRNVKPDNVKAGVGRGDE